MWPSGPTPSITTSNSPAPSARSSSPYAAAPSSRLAADSVEGIGWIFAGSGSTWSRNASRAALSLRSSEAGSTNRSSPHQTTTCDQSTSEVPDSRASSRWTASAMLPPVSAICGVAPPAWASARRVSSSPATAVASASAESCTSISGGGHSDLLFTRVRATAA